jgi:plastocyanin
MLRFRMAPLGLVLLSALVGTASWAATQEIIQKNRAFQPKTADIQVGDTLQVSNSDEFTHHLYIQSDSMAFDSGEKEPGQSAAIKFTKAGAFDVLCRIHPKMVLKVTVK